MVKALPEHGAGKLRKHAYQLFDAANKQFRAHPSQNYQAVLNSACECLMYATNLSESSPSPHFISLSVKLNDTVNFFNIINRAIGETEFSLKRIR